MLRKRLMAVVLSAVMTAAIFTGCASKDDSSKSDNKSAKTEQQKSDAKEEKSKDSKSEAAKAPIEDGTYTAEFKTDSTMFHVNEANEGKGTLTVEDGKMTIHISLVSKNIVNLFPGTAKEAQKKGAKLLEPTTDKVTYSDGTTEAVTDNLFHRCSDIFCRTSISWCMIGKCKVIINRLRTSNEADCMTEYNGIIR